MDLFEIYCSERELQKLFHAKHGKRLLDYELARAKAHLAKVARWERDIQRKAQLQAPVASSRSHRASNAAALRDIKG